ncbi:MAG TPA: ABC transporter substrate-binding protein [Candidatus Pullichristensenella avicola]|nr:ABC transporter substrate-binding protein [Candidatus Pullichristensenella avicola]
MKRMFALLTALCLALLCLAPALAEEAPEKTGVTMRVASLKGPTTMGLVKLMQDAEAGLTANDYTFAMEGTADAISPLLIQGELDAAMIPCNLAAVLIGRTEGALEIAAINTLGVLYVLENGDTIQSVGDLRGKTIFSTGQGTTPEYALDYVLSKNGIDPDADVTVEFRSESTEVASAMLNDAASIAVLPQPFVTSVLMQNENVRVALSLTDEWDKVGDGSAMITGVCVVRKAFAEEHPEAVNAFLEEYAASTEYVNANPAEAAEWIAELEIVGNAAIAEAAIPACNIVCITGEEMITKASGYIDALYEQNPEAVGGQMANETYFYIAESEG